MAETVKAALVKGAYERPWCYRWEDNDCTVHCFAHVASISYDLAWRVLNAHGRIPKAGMYFQRDIIPFLNVTDLSPAFKNMTLNNAMPIFQLGGTYIVSTKGHVFAVINGQLMNHSPINYRDILGVWKVKESK